MLHAYFGTRRTTYSKAFLLSIELVLKPRVSTAYYALQISARRGIFRTVRKFVGMPTMFIDLFVFFFGSIDVCIGYRTLCSTSLIVYLCSSDQFHLPLHSLPLHIY